MRRAQKAFRVLAAASGAICLVPAAAWANSYTGPAASSGTAGDQVAINSVIVTSDTTNLYFLINLGPTATITAPSESYGIYSVGFQMPGIALSGNTTIENEYGEPIGISTGMNYWLGSWANQTTTSPNGPDTGGAELFQYSGSTPTRVAGIGTSTPYVPMPVTLTNTSTMITCPLTSLGLGNNSNGEGSGGTFNFDVWATFDTGSQGPYSALDAPAATFTTGTYSEPWNGTAYDSATVPNSTFSTTTYTMLNWNNSGTGGGDGQTWSTSASNWSSGGTNAVAYSDNDANGHANNVMFDDNNNSNYNVKVSGTVSPGSISFGNSSGNYNITGTGSISGSTWLTLNGSSNVTLANTGTNTFTGATTVNNGTLVIGAKGALPSGNAVFLNNSVLTNAAATGYTVSTGNMQLASNTGGETLSSLSIAAAFTSTLSLTGGSTVVNVPGSTLDVTNNHVIINYGATDPKSTILGYLTTGANGGAWNGVGIVSSTAANLVGQNYGVGFSDGNDGLDPNLTSGQIIVGYAQYGDITMQGLVNAADFHLLAENFGQVTTNGWEAGDFLYTGTVNAEDFHLLAENFGQTASGEDVSMPASDWAALDAFEAANGLSITSVPEPAMLGLLGLSGAALLARRRRTVT